MLGASGVGGEGGGSRQRLLASHVVLPATPRVRCDFPYLLRTHTGSERLSSGLTVSVHQSLLSLACGCGIRLSGAPRGLPHVAKVESPWAGSAPRTSFQNVRPLAPRCRDSPLRGSAVGPGGFQSQLCEKGDFFFSFLGLEELLGKGRP